MSCTSNEAVQSPRVAGRTKGYCRALSSATARPSGPAEQSGTAKSHG